MKRRGRALSGADPDTRHRARIAARKARYATEFFAALYRGKQIRPLLKALTALQDELGKANDAAVAGRLLGRMAQLRPDLAAVIVPVRGALAQRALGCDSKLRKLWQRTAAIKLPR